MPPLRGPSDPSSDRLGPTYALAGLFRARSTLQPSRRLRLAVLTLSPALVAVCGSMARAQPTAVGDRYSGEVYVQPAYAQPAETSGPTLSWPGKTPASASQPSATSSASPWSGPGEQMRAPSYAYAAQTYRPAPPMAYPAPVTQQVAQPPAYQAPGYQPPAYSAQVAHAPVEQAGAYAAPPVTPWYQRYGSTAASSAASPPSAPQSIYDPPASQGGAATGAPAPTPSAPANPTPTPAATAATGAETARFYSLHRQYGLTPDPDPIPPQLFTQTADLSDPVGPSPVYKAANSTGASTTAVHAVQSDDPMSTLGQP